MSGTLDRHVARQFARAALQVTLAALAAVLIIDVLLSYHVLARPAPWSAKLELLAARVPGLLNFALPVAALVAALAVALPMLRSGECIALGAAGLSLSRAFRSVLLGCLALGALDALLALQATPLATARAVALQDAIEGRAREGRVWTEAGVSWFAGRLRVVGAQRPLLEVVVAARPGSVLQADRLQWDPAQGWLLADGGWLFRVVDGEQRLTRVSPGPLPGDLALPLPPEALFRRLLPRHTMTARELWERGERGDSAVLWGRAVRLAVPALMAMCALPVLVRFRNLGRLAVATAESAFVACVPAAIVSVAVLGADATPGPPALSIGIGLLLAAVPALWLWLRWRL